MTQIRYGSALVWTVPVLAAALSVAALVVNAQTAARTALPGELYLADAWVALVYPVVGAWLFGHGRVRAAAVVMLTTAALAVTGLATAWAAYDATDGGLRTAGMVAAWVATWTWTPYLLLPTVLPLWYVADRARPRSGILLSRSALLLVAVITLLSAIAPGPVNDSTDVPNPLGVEAWAGWLGPAAALPGVVILVLAPLTVVALARERARHHPPGSTAALVGATAFVTAALTAGLLPYPWNDVWTAAGASVLPVAFVLDHQLRGVREHEDALVRHMVVARDEERRRLRQDLHDGIAPHLAGLSLRVEGLIPGSGAGEREELADVSTQLRESVVEVRRIVDGLSPQAVDRLGLVGAVRAYAEQVAPGVVEVEADDLPRLPEAVETTAYRIVVEALANAARHAGAGRVEVALTRADQALRVQVADDGVGGARPRAAGLGLGGMVARAVALGGSCRIADRTPRGTVVEAVLPLAEP